MRVARDLADPRWKRIRVRHGSGGRKKWKSGVVIGGKRGKAATQGASGSASLVLYEDGKERVEDLDAVEWKERDRVRAQVQPSARAKSGGRSSTYRGVGWHKTNKKWRVPSSNDGRCFEVLTTTTCLQHKQLRHFVVLATERTAVHFSRHICSEIRVRCTAHISRILRLTVRAASVRSSTNLPRDLACRKSERKLRLCGFGKL